MDRDIWLDVRTIPQRERHAQIFALFEALHPQQTLVVTSDHEPRPLRAQFDERFEKRYTWDQRRLGDGWWEVRIAKCTPTGEDRSLIAVLRRNAILSTADAADLADLASRSRRVSIKRHHTVVEQGTRWPYAGIVESGIVQAVLATPSGREQALYDVLPDELFGETALLDAGVSPVRHIALTPRNEVVLVPVDALAAVARHNPKIVTALGSLAAQRFRTVLERFSTHLGAPALTRVARALLPFAQPGPGLREALAPLPAMTQVEIATSAGTVKEVVSRALADLESLGALQRQGGHIVRLNREILTQVSTNDLG